MRNSEIPSIDPKVAYKNQALERRSKQFTPAMHQSILQTADKQTMFECAEVLFEVVKAVEKGK